MNFISEEQSAALINQDLAYTAVREALIAAAGNEAKIFPAVLAHGSSLSDRFSIKSGATSNLAGLKVGSYWPENDKIGIPRHNSTIVLFDQATGRVGWVIEAGKVNAYRTAAADAVAADVLARADASILAIFGTGNQALYECRAIARIRSISEVLVVARDPAKASAFATVLVNDGIKARVTNGRDACEHADIVVTATSARQPLFEAEWIKPGTHIASMGSDAAGKQELPPALFDCASLYCDLPTQAVIIGDLQHFTGDRGLIGKIGDVLAGRWLGRTSYNEITVFDSSGIALQDLYTARHIIEAFERRNEEGL